MFKLIFLFVASLDRTSFSIDIVEMLSDLKCASPLLKIKQKTEKHKDKLTATGLIQFILSNNIH